ncbi:MAG: nuclear transport factor 2 family protein [Bacteroidota bacterium]
MTKLAQLISKNTIVQMEQTLVHAMQHCDVEMLDELLHEDLLFTIPNGDTITKTVDSETYRSGNMNIAMISASKQEINLIDDCAVVSVVIEMKGTFFDFPLDGTYKVIRIWKVVDTQWKVIAGSSIKINIDEK